MKVNIYSGTTQELLASAIDLADAIPDADERAPAHEELIDNGRVWIGGGGAPLILLVRVWRYLTDKKEDQ